MRNLSCHNRNSRQLTLPSSPLRISLTKLWDGSDREPCTTRSTSISDRYKFTSIRSYKLDAVKLLDSRVKKFLRKHIQIWYRQIRRTRRSHSIDTTCQFRKNLCQPRVFYTQRNQNFKRDFVLENVGANFKFNVLKLKKYALDAISKATSKQKASEDLSDLNVLSLTHVLERCKLKNQRYLFIHFRKEIENLKERKITKNNMIAHAIDRIKAYAMSRKRQCFTKWHIQVLNAPKVLRLVMSVRSVLKARRKQYFLRFWGYTLINLKQRQLALDLICFLFSKRMKATLRRFRAKTV